MEPEFEDEAYYPQVESDTSADAQPYAPSEYESDGDYPEVEPDTQDTELYTPPQYELDTDYPEVEPDTPQDTELYTPVEYESDSSESEEPSNPADFEQPFQDVPDSWSSQNVSDTDSSWTADSEEQFAGPGTEGELASGQADVQFADFSINQAGAGFTVGDWNFGVTPKGSTDDRYDNPQNRARAEQKDADAREAQRRGDPSPREWWKPQAPPSVDPNDPVTRSIEKARERLNEQQQQPLPPPAPKPEPGDYPLPSDEEKNA